MASPLLHLVNQFLDALEQIQLELLDLFQVKRQALLHGEVQEMLRLNDREKDYSTRLQAILAFRNRILSKLREQGEEFPSLEQLAIRFQHLPEWKRILERIHDSNRTQGTLRQESWIHWIISHRCYNHYTEILDLIAHQGHKEVVYSERPHQSVMGGSMLDASA